ncbi:MULTISPECIES: exonuclease domain-containing protein [unclassified Desulfovibrio]|uniref:exonuclease domain-containing protein n=1 Tax=unclassified Desulfovibrio TaxID=2593640 RepID=UPI0021AB1DCB|nr:MULTISPECIES: exonuclease domain-containing protein [unclassified Desulfovibrio]
MSPSPPVALRCVAIDFETSGHAAHSACAVGMARIDKGGVSEVFYSLLRPPSSKVLFTEVHGLTWAMLQDAPTFAQAYPAIAGFLHDTDVLLAHNASFDRRVLRGCCTSFRKPLIDLPFLCTLRGARRSLPLPSKKLSAVCGHFGIALNHHHAGSDAAACAEVYLRLRSLGVSDAQMRI